MIQVSLDSEPPPIFRGQKQGNKKNKNLPQVIFSIRNEKNIDKSNLSRKNIEKNLRDTSVKDSSKGNYSGMEINVLETSRISLSNNVQFSRPSIADLNLISGKFDYLNTKEGMTFSDRKSSEFYAMSSGYSFGTPSASVEYDEKKERNYQSKGNEEKDRNYVLGVLEEEKKPVDEIRDNAIKWDPSNYN